jgi:hypothetical protein
MFMSIISSRLKGAGLMSRIRARAGGAGLAEAVIGQRAAQLKFSEHRQLHMTTPVMMGRRAAKIAARKACVTLYTSTCALLRANVFSLHDKGIITRVLRATLSACLKQGEDRCEES